MSSGNDGGVFGAFFMGALAMGFLIFMVMHNTKPTLEEHELYRFCLIKSIPLEECIVPKKPYKGGE